MKPLFLLVLAIAGCKKPPVAAVPALPPVTLSIAAINDFHGGLYEVSAREPDGAALGGLPWLVAAVRTLRDADDALLLLDGGDAFQGSWPVNATAGRGAIEAFALLGVDASAVGNHEFDYGGVEGGDPRRGALEAAAARAPYPLLSANIYKDGQRWAPKNVAPWTLIERKGVKIAVVGLTTTDTPTTTTPANVADLTFTDPVQAVRDVLPEIEASGATVRILVAHLTGACRPTAYVRNDDACTPDGEIGRLLTELPEGTFDVMVLGHAHTVLHHRIGDTFLLENRSGGHMIGRVDLVVGPDGVNADASRVHEPWALQHAPVDPGCSGAPFPTAAIDVGGRELSPDPEALALVGRLEVEAGSLCDELTCASRALGRDRAAETELGNWMADALLAAVPKAQVAIQNSGGIRADLPAGTVRRESLQRIMPFDNRVVTIDLTGKDLRTVLRIGSSGAHGILQIAGAAYTVDKARTDGSDIDGDGAIADWERDRLCNVTVGGKALEDTATYRVVTSDFLSSGGDHLGPGFENGKLVDQGALLRDAFYQQALNTKGCIGDKPLVDPEKPRIHFGTCP